jgi:hypothetical protein
MSWITFIDVGMSASGKTQEWGVQPLDNLSSSGCLGVIKWYGPWRKYCFFPNGNTVFEQDCLRDISLFVETRTKLHREKRLAKST